MKNLGYRVNRPARWALLIVVAATVLATVPASAAEECQIPLFVKNGGGAAANVMILADNSGSMNTVIYHPDYDEKTTYLGDFDGGRDGTRRSSRQP